MLEILTIIAIFVGPFVGIYAQSWVAYYKEHKAKQLYIFRTLITDHSQNISAEYVAALNLIPIDFSNKKKKEKPVIIAWETLLNHLVHAPEEKDYKNDAEYTNAEQIAEEKEWEYRIDLLFELSKCLGYNFERLDIKGARYVATNEDEEKDEKKAIREGLILLLAGSLPLNVNMKTSPKKPSSKKAKK